MKNLLKQPANINNNNNNNDINNNNNLINNTTLNWSCRLSDEGDNETSSSSLGKPSKENIVSQREGVRKLPPEWRGIKLDLFCNGNNKDGSAMLKLNISVLRKIDGAQHELQAVLNSKFDDAVRRGVDKVAWNTDGHWISVKQHKKELEYLLPDVRISKIGKKSKGGGTEWVAFVYSADSSWCVDIIRESQVYHFVLDQPLSEKQQAQGNTIATGYFGHRKQAQLINPRKEWGI